MPLPEHAYQLAACPRCRHVKGEQCSYVPCLLPAWLPQAGERRAGHHSHCLIPATGARIDDARSAEVLVPDVFLC